MKPILYLDSHATTPLDPRVLGAMQPYFSEQFGNAASHHAYGWEAEAALEKARQEISYHLAPCVGFEGTEPQATLTFTSGTTESNNAVLKGVFFAHHSKPVHIITQKTEHDSILNPCRYLEKLGCEVTYLGVDQEGFVDPDDVKKALKPHTYLVSVMAANHEVGTIQNLKEISEATHRQDHTLFHVDAAQALGKIPLDVVALRIDFLSASAHKIYGPKGVGLLYHGLPVIGPGHDFVPLLHGGHQESKWRSGTVNVPGVVGFAKALKLCCEELPEESERLIKLRDYFWKKIQNEIDLVWLNGPKTNRLPGNLNVSFEFVETAPLMAALPELAFSSGSACAAQSTKPSPVIMALHGNETRAKTSARFGLGRSTTKNNIDQAVDLLAKAVRKIRAKSLEYEMHVKGK